MATANDLNISQAGYVVFDGTAVFTGRTFQAGTGVTLTNASGVSGNTTISASASVPTTFTGNSGVATPSLNNLNVVTANSTVKFVGSGATLTEDFAMSNLLLGSNGAITSGTENTGIGYQSLQLVQAGYQNTALGYQAMANANGDHLNVAIGARAMQFQAGGNQNVAVGYNALAGGNSQGNCVAIGALCQSTSNSTGGSNISIGTSALSSEATGSLNISIGYQSGQYQNGGSNNCYVGSYAGQTCSGSNNTFLGTYGGFSYTSTENSNICINNGGIIGDTNTIRIGGQGSTAGLQNKCYIAGIVGNTVSNAQVVTINSSTGQLGVSNTGMVWTDVTGATQTLAVNNGYITDRSGGVTYTLPSTASLGDTIKIDGKLGITTITPNANQQILMGSASGTVGVTGTAVATNVGDCIQLRCITSGASTVWRAENWVGNWTLT